MPGEEPSYLTLLFGVEDDGAVGASSASPVHAFQLDSEEVCLELAFEIERLSRLKTDWQSRIYKHNPKAIYLRGDGPARNESMSISQANERRRRRHLEAMDMEISAMLRLQAQLAKPDGRACFERVVMDCWDGAFGPDQSKHLDRFEALVLDRLNIRPAYGAYSSTALSKLLRRHVETPGQDQPEVPRERAR